MAVEAGQFSVLSAAFTQQVRAASGVDFTAPNRRFPRLTDFRGRGQQQRPEAQVRRFR